MFKPNGNFRIKGNAMLSKWKSRLKMKGNIYTWEDNS